MIEPIIELGSNEDPTAHPDESGALITGLTLTGYQESTAANDSYDA
jgi:hypothetical protein